MKRPIGAVLMLAGLAFIIVGGYIALSALGGLYQSNLTDPLNQPEGAEQAASREMLRGAIIGAIGLPAWLAGAVLWKLGKRRKPV